MKCYNNNMKKEKVLILGNKQYYNFKLDDIVDSFDKIYRFNMAWPGKNNGTKFGNLAMCSHMYLNMVENPVSKDNIFKIYGDEMEKTFLYDWYDFFQENNKSFDDIFFENPNNGPLWNKMLEDFGCPYRFASIPSTGCSVMFRNLAMGNEIYVLGFTLHGDEIRKTYGEKEEVSMAKNQGQTVHSFSTERSILAWLHNNEKVDASLCMLKDTTVLNLQSNEYNTEPSEFILNLINKE